MEKSIRGIFVGKLCVDGVFYPSLARFLQAGMTGNRHLITQLDCSVLPGSTWNKHAKASSSDC